MNSSPPRPHPAFGRRVFLKGALAGVAFAGAPGLLSACSSGSTASTTGPTNMTFQFSWLKLEPYNGFYIADEKGFYADQGVKPTLNSGGPNISASQVVNGGRANLGDEDNISLLQAQSKGLELVAFATVFQKSPYACMSRSDKPIHTLKDFAGKTIAIDTPGRAQLEPALKGAGVTGVNIVPGGPEPTQLLTGQVDGYFGYATSQGITLEQHGMNVTYAFVSDLGFGGYNNVLMAPKKTIDAEHANLVKFLRATIMGYEMAAKNPDYAAELTVSKYAPPGSVLATEKLVAKAQLPLMTNPKGMMWIEEERMQSIIDAQVRGGTITKSLKASDIMTTAILEDAYAGKKSLLGT